MEKVIRPLWPHERAAAEALWHHGFPEDEDAFVTLYFDRFFTPQNVWGVFVDGVLAADLFMPLRTMHWADADVATANIAGVATHSDYRSRGLARELLLRAEEDLRARGVAWAFLYPFSHAFYEKLGYVSTHVWQEVSFVPAAGEESDVLVRRLADREAPTALGRIYRDVMAVYDGFLLRDAADWHFRVAEARLDGDLTLGAYRAGNACGYLFAQLDHGVIEVGEWLFDDACAARALLLAAWQAFGAHALRAHVPDAFNVADIGFAFTASRQKAQMVKPLCGQRIAAVQKPRLMLELY